MSELLDKKLLLVDNNRINLPLAKTILFNAGLNARIAKSLKLELLLKTIADEVILGRISIK